MANLIHPKVAEVPTAYLDGWLGSTCQQVIRRENNWYFEFDGRGGLSAECPWRILDQGRIAHADEDDGQQFGLPEPVNGAARALGLLRDKAITSVEISPITGDLKIQFGGATALEFFVNSSGYESWQASAKRGRRSINLVAQGGGQISFWEDEA